MSFKTVRKIHGFTYTKFPITEEVITSVEEIDKEDKQPLMKKVTIFEWSPGNIILDKQEKE